MIEEAQIAVRKLISPIIACYANEYPPEKLKEEGTVEYPHAIFSFPNAVPNNEYSNKYLLQIDIWDNKGGDASEIETLTDAVFYALNKKDHGGLPVYPDLQGYNFSAFPAGSGCKYPKAAAKIYCKNL